MDKSQQVKKIQTALKKSIGSINKMLSLLDEGVPECSDVLIQLDSAIGSLQSARNQTLDTFLDNCLRENIQSGDIKKLKHQLNKLYKLKK